jgi:hypothetical protein
MKTTMNLFLIIIGLSVLFQSCKNKQDIQLDIHKLDFAELFTYSLSVNDSILLDSITDIMVDSISKYRIDFFLSANEVVDSIYNDIKLEFHLNYDDPNGPVPSIKKRNLYILEITESNFVRAEGSNTERIDTLERSIKEFILNPENRDDLPQKRLITIEPYGDVEVSKGAFIIYLKTDFDFKMPKKSFRELIKLTNLILHIYSKIRDKTSLNRFGKSFKELDLDKKVFIAKYIPLSILIYLYEIPKPPPLPTFNISFQ